MRKFKRNNSSSSNKRILAITTLICVVLLILSFAFNSSPKFIAYSNFVLAPMKKGVTKISNGLIDIISAIQSRNKLIEENQKFKNEIAQLKYQNNILNAEHEKYERMKEQYNYLKDTSYDYVGSEVIGKSHDNWFNIITLDRGSKDDIKQNMNVIANGSLIGIVTSVSYNSCVVRTIIDDLSATSAIIEGKESLLIVEGNINTIKNGYLLGKILNQNTDVVVGDKVLTSNVSKNYLPDLLIGFVSEVIKNEKGIIEKIKIVPSSDFSYLRNVSIIKNLKVID